MSGRARANVLWCGAVPVAVVAAFVQRPAAVVVHVLVREGDVLALDVTAEPLPTRRGRARLQARLEQLQAWRGEPT